MTRLKTKGPLVKRLRRSPLKAESWVRFPYGSPAKQKGHSHECPFCFAATLYESTHLQICEQIWIGFAFSTKTVVSLLAKGRAKIVHEVNLPTCFCVAKIRVTLA